MWFCVVGMVELIIVVKGNATERQVEAIIKHIEDNGLKADVSKGTERTVIGAIGDERKLVKEQLQALPGVEQVLPILKPYKLASRELHPHDTVIKVRDVAIGGKDIVIMAGPCSVESEGQLMTTAKAVKASGAKILRASAFKPRTSPYDFQGMEEEGLKIIKKVGEKVGIVTETEVMDIRDVEVVAKHVDIVRIGARNMQNFDLLKEVGKINKPVILKNGISSTIKEFLMAAEYIMSEGNKNVILCLRGVRTFEPEIRFPLDVSYIPLIKESCHLPVIVDPSHWTGKTSLVPAASKASIAAGADGLIIEVHPNPKKAVSDAGQQLTPAQFAKLMPELRKVAEAVGRKIQ